MASEGKCVSLYFSHLKFLFFCFAAPCYYNPICINFCLFESQWYTTQQCPHTLSAVECWVWHRWVVNALWKVCEQFKLFRTHYSLSFAQTLVIWWFKFLGRRSTPLALYIYTHLSITAQRTHARGERDETTYRPATLLASSSARTVPK